MGGGGVLNVDGDDISSCLGKVGDTELRLDNHEMDIQGLVGDGAEGINDERTNGDVGDEATVHDINVDPISTSLIDGFDL